MFHPGGQKRAGQGCCRSAASGALPFGLYAAAAELQDGERLSSAVQEGATGGNGTGQLEVEQRPVWGGARNIPQEGVLGVRDTAEES